MSPKGLPLDTINIITLFAIILFARLGIRLLFRYLRDRKKDNRSE